MRGLGIVAVVDEGLREWDYGVYEGKTTAEIREEIPGWSVWKDEIVGGETAEHVGERADGVIARALAAAPAWGEGGFVCSCAYSADSCGALDWIGGRWGEVAGAGDGERQCVGMGTRDSGD